MTRARVVLTTVGSQDAAERLSSQLVERRLAACLNIIGPIRSVYRWKGNIENAAEYLLIIKTTSENVAQLSAAFAELHPYEVPECIALEIEGGSQTYLAWLASEVRSEH